MEFLDYVDKEYQVNLSKRALSSFQKNKERDLAILALLLASGVRLSEAVNSDLRDVNLNMMIIEVTRKGGKRDSVNVAGFAKPYLEAYMGIRQQRYKAEKRIQPSSCPNTVVCLTVSMLLLLKNGCQVLCGLQDTRNPHKLRHTLATRLYDATKSQVLVSHQLGHANTQVTDLYTHIVNDEQKNALDQL